MKNKMHSFYAVREQMGYWHVFHTANFMFYSVLASSKYFLLWMLKWAKPDSYNMFVCVHVCVFVSFLEIAPWCFTLCRR